MGEVDLFHDVSVCVSSDLFDDVIASVSYIMQGGFKDTLFSCVDNLPSFFFFFFSSKLGSRVIFCFSFVLLFF